MIVTRGLTVKSIVGFSTKLELIIKSLIGNSIYDILNAALEIFKQQSHRSADGISAIQNGIYCEISLFFLLLLNFESDSKLAAQFYSLKQNNNLRV